MRKSGTCSGRCITLSPFAAALLFQCGGASCAPFVRPRFFAGRKMDAAVLKRWTFRAFWSKIITLAPVAQLDRVSDSDSEGHRFDSCRVYHTPAVFTAGAFFPSAGVLPDTGAERFCKITQRY